MTCEIAVMNLWGLALATDSAVTLGDGAKIYNSAEKLFQLGNGAPMGIMTFGEATYAGVPWEVIIADYSRKLDGRRFDTVQQCVDDFLGYLRRTPFLTISPEQQVQTLKSQITGLWQALYAKPLTEAMEYEDQPKEGMPSEPKTLSVKTPVGRNPREILLGLIREDHTLWEQHAPWEGVDAAWADDLIRGNAKLLDGVEAEVFPDTDLLDDEVRAALRKTVGLFLTLTAHGPGTGDVVIGGVGDTAPFPSLVQCQIAPMLGGRFRTCKRREYSVTSEDDAMIIPFAQTDAIDTLIRGIHPEMEQAVPDMIREHLSGSQEQTNAWDLTREFAKKLQKKVETLCSDPFMRAVSALPRGDLAALAEALVSLQIFLARHSVNTTESVQGPVDVAVLSKSCGFQWVKRKNLLGDMERPNHLNAIGA